jgi:hypothetical protein
MGEICEAASCSRVAGRQAKGGLRLLLALAAVGTFAPSTAAANGTYLPLPHKIFHGLTYSGQQSDTKLFSKQTRSHSAVSNYYVTWGSAIQEAMESWDERRARGLLTITASHGHGQPGVIDPRQIERGKGDAWLLQLNKTLGKWRDPVYLSLFPEMNGSWNSYSAFNSSGSRRPGNSTKSFSRAWQRTTLIMRGGSVRKINRQLHTLDLPKIRGRGSIYRRMPRRIPRPKVSMMWVPQAHGTPAVSGNGPADYWPGNAYVDWVGADTFSKFSNFGGLNSIHRNFALRYHKPMMIGEYAPWGSDASSWVKKLHSWARRNARMLIYYQGFGEEENPFKLEHYPRTKRLLRKILNRSYFQVYASGIHTRKHGKGSIAITTTRDDKPAGNFTVCRTKTQGPVEYSKQMCASIVHGHGHLTGVPEGHWYLRTREPNGQSRCWQRPDMKAHTDRCGRVRVKNGAWTEVRWPLRGS